MTHRHSLGAPPSRCHTPLRLPTVDQMVHPSRSIGFHSPYRRLNNLSADSIHWRMLTSPNMVESEYATAAWLASDGKDEQVKRVTPTKPVRVLPMNIPKLLFDLIKGIIVSSE